MGKFRIFTVENDELVTLQEELIIDVTEQIWERLNELELSKAELAQRLGTSKSNVTQLLSGARNMTLRTVGQIAYVLGTDVCFRLGNGVESSAWEEVGTALLTQRAVHGGVQEIESANCDWMDVADTVVPA